MATLHECIPLARKVHVDYLQNTKYTGTVCTLAQRVRWYSVQCVIE